MRVKCFWCVWHLAHAGTIVYHSGEPGRSIERTNSGVVLTQETLMAARVAFSDLTGFASATLMRACDTGANCFRNWV